MKKTLKRPKNTKAIKKIGELLREKVLDSFGWYGIGTPVAAEAAPDAATPGDEDQAEENETEDNDEEDYEPPQYYFDPTDVQMAVDEAISDIIDEGLIKEFSNPKKPPKLAQIFAVLFGTNSEIMKQIEYFEELISGYEDRAHIDDLKEAHGILESVVRKISPKQRELNHNG
jgi:hypothetical protein